MMFADLWFENPQWWFSSDSTLIKYDYLFDSIDDNTTILDKVLIYDQLSRHVFKNYGAHIIEFYLQKALYILENYVELNYLDSLTDNEWCFMMLPYRHTKNQEIIYNLMNYAWKESPKRDLHKFMKAMYERCPTNNQDMTYYKFNHNDNINNNLVLSLSGGVDSMLCSKLYGPLHSAIHINYMNRGDTSLKEEEFVIDWCKTNNINLYVRRINEINRRDAMLYDMRNTYESYTRNVRYGCYKTILKNINNGKIILGHNKDDCMENIFTNIASCNHYENLNGMTEYSEQDDIIFYRPMLNKSKAEIEREAHKYKIPHLPCSTPSWSQRGQIRNTLVPILNKWNDRFILGLFQLSKNMNVLTNIFDNIIADYSSAKYIVLSKDDIILTNHYFWKTLLYKRTGKIISDKSIKNFIERIQGKNPTGKCDLNKDLQINIENLIRYKENI